jgi:hypothetical protein
MNQPVQQQVQKVNNFFSNNESAIEPYINDRIKQ